MYMYEVALNISGAAVMTDAANMTNADEKEITKLKIARTHSELRQPDLARSAQSGIPCARRVAEGGTEY